MTRLIGFCDCPFCEFRIRYQRAVLHRQGSAELGLPAEYGDRLLVRLQKCSQDLWNRMYAIDEYEAAILAGLVKAFVFHGSWSGTR